MVVKSNAPSGHKWITTGAWDNFVFDVHMCVCFINKFANMYTYKLLSALKKKFSSYFTNHLKWERFIHILCGSYYIFTSICIWQLFDNNKQENKSYFESIGQLFTFSPFFIESSIRCTPNARFFIIFQKLNGTVPAVDQYFLLFCYLCVQSFVLTYTRHTINI